MWMWVRVRILNNCVEGCNFRVADTRNTCTHPLLNAVASVNELCMCNVNTVYLLCVDMENDCVQNIPNTFFDICTENNFICFEFILLY